MQKYLPMAAAFLLLLTSCSKINNNPRNAVPGANITIPRSLVTANIGSLKVITIAGNKNVGDADGRTTSAFFVSPAAIAVDRSGNMYVADAGSHRIRRISSGGLVTTLAGNGSPGSSDGQGAAASFNTPTGIAVDTSGNIFVADCNNHRIRKITSGGMVSTWAGTGVAGYTEGPGASAQFHNPSGVAVDAAGNVYVADAGNFRIRKINTSGVVALYAGTGNQGLATGPGNFAEFGAPVAVSVDASGILYVADSVNHQVRRITTSRVVSVLAGDADGISGYTDGPALSARFKQPAGVTVDGSGNVYVADKMINRIRKIAGGSVSTFAGNGVATFSDGTTGPSGTASFFLPSGLAADIAGNVYVADWGNHRIREAGMIASVTTIVSIPDWWGPQSAVRSQNGSYYGANSYGVFTASNGSVSVLAGILPPVVLYGPWYQDGYTSDAKFSGTCDVALPPIGLGQSVIVSDQSNNRIRSISPPVGFGIYVSTIAGGDAGYADGPVATARFNQPSGIAMDTAGAIYVADRLNGRIRKIANGIVTTIAGNGTAGLHDGQDTTASFKYPYDVALDATGNIYVADAGNNCIRKITPTGFVSTLAGSGVVGSADGIGSAAQFNTPYALTVDAAGNVYVSDSFNARIRKITPDGKVTTIAGGDNGVLDGPANLAQFSWPMGISIDPDGALIVSDSWMSGIRRIQ